MKHIIFLFLFITVTACITEEPLNNSFNTFEPKNISDGHSITTPSEEGINDAELTRIYEDVYSDENLWSMRSLLVFRNGNLVAESYLKDDNDITTQHLIWSCTKQVMGALTGIALENKVIESLDDPISKYFNEELANHKDKEDIKIRDLLTMRSGIDYENSGTEGESDKFLRQLPNNSVDFILDQSLQYSPGETFRYKDGDPHLLSAIIQNVTGKYTDVWADEVLFSKIGLTNYNWVRYKDGVTFGGFGIETTPRELAKVALCVADSGRWNSEQVIPKNWIVEMTDEQVNPEGDYSFGYYWWIDKTRNIHFMWGHGGQFAFIVPGKNLVVVITSIPNTQGDYQIHADEALTIVDQIVKISN